MTDQARVRNTRGNTKMRRKRKRTQLRIGCWNVRSFSGRDQEIILELRNKKIDICAISETKKRGKGTEQYGDYILIYSGRPKETRATSGVGVLIDYKYQNIISDIEYRSDRILKISLKLENHFTHIISVYAPDTGRPTQEALDFYEQLQLTVDKIPKQDQIIIMGDMNGRVGNEVIPGIKNVFNEEIINDRGEMLIEFCTYNELRINNTYFRHKPQHKITFRGSRGVTSTIDYILTNRAIVPEQVLDIRSLTSANIGSDHNLVLGVISGMRRPTKADKQHDPVTKFNIESLKTESILDLYRRRLTNKIEETTIGDQHTVNEAWKILLKNINEAAEEALGKRTIKATSHQRREKPWFTSEVKDLAQEKKEAHLTYINNKTPRNFLKYTEIRNRVNKRIREIKKEHWENFSREMENDLYGTQKRIWKMLRAAKKEVNETVQIHNITADKWKEYFTNLHSQDNDQPLERRQKLRREYAISLEEDKRVTTEEVMDEMKHLKNGKAPGPDNIPNELLKQGGVRLAEQLTKLFNKILGSAVIPDEWKESITIPLFKKGKTSDPANYRGISLLNTSMKLFTRILGQHILQHTKLCEEQQGFRKNRSTVDAVFVVRQVIEKSIEYDKHAYLCFIDLSKAFDRIQLTDVVEELKHRGIHPNIVETIKQLNTGNTTTVKTRATTTDKVKINLGVRQGDSLSPLLFNLIMDRIIHKVRRVNQGYRMGNELLKILCYADDAVLFADSEDGLQWLIQAFYREALELNMVISIPKTKSMVIAREPRRCKLEINNKIIEQVFSFNYLGVTISPYGSLKDSVRHQMNKAARISGALRNIIWKNNCMTTTSKVRIYKACVRPIMTYAAETRAETAETKRMARTNEMRVLRAITGNTLRDQRRSDEIRKECQTEDVVRWTRARRRFWNEHVSRMSSDRIAKIARNGRPASKRPVGRPPKRWKDSWTSISQEREEENG